MKIDSNRLKFVKIFIFLLGIKDWLIGNPSKSRSYEVTVICTNCVHVVRIRIGHDIYAEPDDVDDYKDRMKKIRIKKGKKIKSVNIHENLRNNLVDTVPSKTVNKLNKNVLGNLGRSLRSTRGLY